MSCSLRSAISTESDEEMQDRDDASREEEDAPPTRHHRHDRGVHAPPRKGNLYEIDHSELDDGSATDESRPQSKKSNSPVRRVSVRPLKSNFNRTALKELIAAAPPQPTVQSPTEASTSTPAKPIVMVPLMQSGSETPVSTSSSRRKQSNPKSIADLEQSNRDKAVSTPAHTAPGSNPLRHWLGFGAFDEGAAGPGRKPWSIQSWILDGFRRMQSSEAHAKNAKDE